MKKVHVGPLVALLLAALLAMPSGQALAAHPRPAALLASWGVSAPISPGIAPQSQALPNAATPEPSWWTQADRSLYVSAATSPDPRQPSSTPILDTTVGQTLYLSVSAASKSADPCPSSCTATWEVNSPDATVQTTTYLPSMLLYASSGTTFSGISPAAFTATAPGVYTVRAVMGDAASEPLVLTVGLSSLTATPSARPLWVVPEPRSALAADPSSGATATPFDGLTVTVGNPVASWIPIYGTYQMPATGSAFLTVWIQGNSRWAYTIPLGPSGTFSDLVLDPFHGGAEVWVQPQVVDPTTLVTSSPNPDMWGTTIANRARGLPTAFDETLPSSMIDYSSPAMAPLEQEALDVWANSPDPVTGSTAISNLVADTYSYDFTDYDAGIIPNAPASIAAQASTGVCEQYANTTTALLRLIGLRTITVSGWAYSPGTPVSARETTANAHAWTKVLIPGMGWLTLDSTWDSWEDTPLAWQTNTFAAADTAFNTSHKAAAPLFGTTNLLGD